MINSLHGIGCVEMMIELLRILAVGKISKVQYQSDAQSVVKLVNIVHKA